MDSFPDKSIFPIAFGFIVLAFFWSTGICMDLIFLVFAAIAGYFLSHFLLKNPNYCRSLQFIYANFIYRNETNLSNKTKPNIFENRKNTQPCDQIKLDALLNRELEQLFETIIENYVNNWYTELSGDASFLLEIRHLLRHSAARIINTITESDLQRILVDDIIPNIIAHIDRICRITNEQFPDSIPGSAHMPSPLVEMKILEKWPDPHWATISSENQANYLRAISDALICKFVDDVRIGGCFVDEEHHRWLDREGVVYATKWSCNSSRHFLRELLFSKILLPTIDYFSDPDSLNQFVLPLINDSQVKDPQIGKSNESNKKEDFLLTFADKMYNHSPDTLLGLKLIDIVRDVNLIRHFELYIRDLNGPVNYLDCFLQTRDILMKIQNINNMQSGRSTKRHEQEIYFDSWQLYSTFIHQNSSNHLQIKEQIVNEFSNVIDQKSGSENLKLLEHVIESIYQEIYQFLQYNYAIPFCQSENFLGYLIGAPIYANDFIGNEEFSTQKSQNIPEKSFTLSQFRKKLFNFVVPSKDRQNSTSTFYPSLSSSDLERLSSNEGIFVNDNKLADLDPESGTISLCDMARDLNKWTVGIQGIEERREMTVKGQFLFSLLIERNDLPEEYYSEKSVEMNENDVEDEMNEKLPRIWTIGHKYEEFYALEDKLRNYYGNGLRMPPLPERKGTLELLRISSQQRTLMESHRPQFERFIQQLLQQSLLRRSDLLYIFLTSDEDNSGIFELIEENDGSNFMTDLNPIRAMRKVAKGERGENLRPFILNSLAKVLSPLTKPCSSMRHQQLSHSLSFDSKESSISRKLDEADDNRSNSSSNRNKKTSNLLNQNFIPRANETHESMNKHISWKSNFYDIFLFLLTTLKIFRLPAWFEALCCSGKYFVDYIFALIFHKKMKEILKQKFLNVETATIIVKILHDLVLPPQQNITNPSSLSATPSQMSIDSSSAPFKKSQQLAAKPQTERHLRAELLLHCLEKRAEGLLPYSRIFSWLVNASSDSINQKTGSLCKTTAILQLFFCFQMPLVNRELAFVLLDIFLERILLIPKLKT